jgi:hypothetical protein
MPWPAGIDAVLGYQADMTGDRKHQRHLDKMAGRRPGTASARDSVGPWSSSISDRVRPSSLVTPAEV